MADNKILFVHPQTGVEKVAPVGFSWDTLAFAFFSPLLRSDWKSFFIMTLLACCTFGFATIYFWFGYNKMYIKGLIAAGYKAREVQKGTIQELSARLELPIPALTETVSANSRECPFCKETIRAEAIKCKHCGSALDDTQVTQNLGNRVISEKTDTVHKSVSIKDTGAKMEVAAAASQSTRAEAPVSSNVKLCSKCGSEIPEGRKFCGDCGAKIDQGSPIATAGPTYSSEPKVEKIPESKEIGPRSSNVKKPYAVIVIVVVIVLLAAGWFLTLSKSSKNQSNIAQSNASPASPVSGPAKFDSFKQYVGKSADDINFYEMPEVKAGMIKSFGTQQKHMINNLSVKGPIELVDNCLIVSGIAPHQGGSEEGIMVFDLQTGRVEGAILSSNARSRNSQIDVYTYATESSTMSSALRRWLDEHKSSPNQAAKYHYIKADNIVPSSVDAKTPRVVYNANLKMIAIYDIDDGTHGQLKKSDGTITSVKYNKKYHSFNFMIRNDKYSESFEFSSDKMTAQDETKLRQDILVKGKKVVIEYYSEGSGGFNYAVNIKTDAAPNAISPAETGPKNRALEEANKAIELNPNDAVAYYNRGFTYEGLRQYKLAIRDYDKVIQLRPDHAGTYYNRAVAYHKLGDLKQATRDYKKAAQLGDKAAQTMLTSNGVKW